MTYFYHAIFDSPYLPRDLEASSAQSAVTTLLGELWPCEDAVLVPSAAIVATLAKAGQSEAAVRAALSRLSRKGTLDVVKDGRQTSYQLSDEVRASIPASQVMTMCFGTYIRPWTGEWTIVVFSLPESERARRAELREWLRWLGFGPARDGVWIAPHANIDLTQEALRDVLPADGLIFKSSQLIGNINPSSLWPLDSLAVDYQRFIDSFRPAIYRLRAGSITPAEALKLWLTILCQWRCFPALDPDLPPSALPPDWPRREARSVFEAVHDETVLLASTLVRQTVAQYSSAAAEAVHPRTVAEIIAAQAEVGQFDINLAAIKQDIHDLV